MEKDSILVTPLGVKRVNDRIKSLEEKRVEQTRIIGEAAAQDADLPENTLFKQAREIVQFQIPQERKVLLNKLSRLVVISEESPELGLHPEDEVWLGSSVQIDIGGDIEQWRIVGHDEGNPDNFLVSYDAPMAISMLGKKVGDVCKINDRFSFTIISVERDMTLFAPIEE